MAAPSIRIASVALAMLSIGAAPCAAQWGPNGIAVCTAPGDQSGARSATDGAGGAIVAWVDNRATGNPDIYAQRVIASGHLAPGWPANGAVVCAATGAQLTPDVVADAAGGAFVVWQDSRKGPGDPDLYVQRITATGAIAAGWPVNGIAVCDFAGVQSNPALVPDGASGTIVTWQDYRSGDDFDVYAQRVSASGARLWTAGGVLVCGAPYDQTSPVCAADGSGGVLAAWEDTRNYDGLDVYSEIYVQHLGPGGGIAPGWPADGAPATRTSGPRSAYAPTIVADGASGALVAWEEAHGDTGGIFALRLTSAGAVAPGWTAGGVPVCDTLGYRSTPLATPDGSGGMVVVWDDYRNGPLRDLYAQHMRSNGARAPGWPATGAVVCNAPGHQAAPRILSDGAGGAVVTWYDFRGGNDTDIYAERLTANGGVASGWATNGTALCVATGDQQTPTAVPDGSGGAVVIWTDRRSGTDYDIYAQLITGTGQVAPPVDVPVTAGPAFFLLAPRPNPASGPTTFVFGLPEARVVEVRIFDLAGRTVRTLADSRPFPSGVRHLTWDGCDQSGRRAAAGVYLVRLRAGDEMQVRRLVKIE
jgi:hypothetical protein